MRYLSSAFVCVFVCRYSLNLYTLLNGQNPFVSRQQTWITDTLQQAEQAGEKVRWR